VGNANLGGGGEWEKDEETREVRDGDLGDEEGGLNSSVWMKPDSC
jgi:hypothetical protein